MCECRSFGGVGLTSPAAAHSLYTVRFRQLSSICFPEPNDRPPKQGTRLLSPLSPGIADRIRRQRLVRDVVPALSRELGELGFTLAVLAWRVRGYLGTVDALFAAWLAEYATRYQGVDRHTPGVRAFQNAAAVQADAQPLRRRSPNDGLNLKEYRLPLAPRGADAPATCQLDHLRARADRTPHPTLALVRFGSTCHAYEGSRLRRHRQPPMYLLHLP